MLGTDTAPEVDVLRGVLFGEVEGANEAAEDRAKHFGPSAWLCSKGREFVDTREEGFPIGLFTLEGYAWYTAVEAPLVFEVRFESRHHQYGAYGGVIIGRGGEFREDPILQILIDDLKTKAE